MAKKIKTFANYSLKTFIHRYRNYNINTYILGNAPYKIFVFLPVPHSGIIISQLFNEQILKKVTLISFDIPGWAGSGYNQSRLISDSDLINITKSIANYLKFINYSVIGIQLGANIATTLASHEENIKKIVLINPIFKKAQLKQKHKNLMIFLKVPFVANLLKLRYILKNKFTDSLLEDNSPFEGYSDKLAKVNPKIIADSLSRYYSADLSLYLESLEHKVLILSTKDTQGQIEYLNRAIGKEAIESYLINEDKDIFLQESGALKIVTKFLFE